MQVFKTFWEINYYYFFNFQLLFLDNNIFEIYIKREMKKIINVIFFLCHNSTYLKTIRIVIAFGID